MTRRYLIAASALSLALALPAFAGQGGECAGNTGGTPSAAAVRAGIVLPVGLDLSIDPASGMVRIARITPGAPAEASGLRQGDVILAVNGIPLGQGGAHQTPFSRAYARGEGRLTIEREGRTREIEVDPGILPGQILDRYAKEGTGRMHDRIAMQQASRDLGRLSSAGSAATLARN